MNSKSFFHLPVLMAVIFVSGCNGVADTPTKLDDLRDKDFLDSVAVLRVKLVKPGEGSKYHWPVVEILDVFKDSSNYDLKTGDTLEVAHYGYEPGIPDGTSIVYLQYYGEIRSNKERFALLGYSGKLGVRSENEEEKVTK